MPPIWHSIPCCHWVFRYAQRGFSHCLGCLQGPYSVPCFDSRCPLNEIPRPVLVSVRTLPNQSFSCLPGLQFVDDGLHYTRRIFLLHIPTFPYDIKLSRRRNGNRCLGLRVSCMAVSLPMSFVFAYLATLPSHVSLRYKYYTSVIRP